MFNSLTNAIGAILSWCDGEGEDGDVQEPLETYDTEVGKLDNLGKDTRTSSEILDDDYRDQ